MPPPEEGDVPPAVVLEGELEVGEGDGGHGRDEEEERKDQGEHGPELVDTAPPKRVKEVLQLHKNGAKGQEPRQQQLRREGREVDGGGYLEVAVAVPGYGGNLAGKVLGSDRGHKGLS